MIKKLKPPKHAINEKLVQGPSQLKQIRHHDISQRKDSYDDSDDGYGSDGFDSDTELKEAKVKKVKIKSKPIIKPNPKLASNPMSFKKNSVRPTDEQLHQKSGDH